ncbi:hypothetical protein RN001_008080, partial [Aquatica leii]
SVTSSSKVWKYRMYTYVYKITKIFANISIKEDVIRQTQYGLVQGEIRKSRAEGSVAEYYYFGGVPYARPPIGSLRFQDPLPPIPWKGILNTSTYNHTCTQLDHISIGPNVIGNEDCLYLEISVPILKQVNDFQNLPVMVWIHGGTFIFSGINDTGPDYFMEEPVVLVAIDYRLNVFGFLNTLDDNARGNAGLKDQLLALKWIKNNIKYFGGDPNKVTIFGCSAGGASVQLHMLSPKSQGLFHRAISESGTPLNPWSFQRHPLEMAKKLASGFGIINTNNKILVEQLQKIPYDKLLKMVANQNVMGFSFLYNAPPFTVSIEADSDSAFLTEKTYGLLESGKINSVPYMLGHTTEEGSFPYDYVNNNVIHLDIFDKNPSLLIPVSMNIPKDSSCNDYTLQKIKNFYFNNSSFSDKINWINFQSSDAFIRGILKSVEMICQQTSVPIYYYQYSYVGNKTSSYTGGATHYAEVQYLLYSHIFNPTENEADKLTRKKLIRLWVNFAHFGNPTPSEESLLENVIWPTYCYENTYLDIGNNFTLLKAVNSIDVAFWEDLINVVRQTEYGLIRGEVRKSRAADSMTEYYYFAGVPYARPPIGSLRFQDPQPPVSWNGVLNTTAHRNTCAQLDHTFAGSNAMGSEDCLYLEVSVPFSKNINVTKKLPVLVWLHGGTFIFSGVNDTGPDYLMEESIILVAVDYRLNVFGFLSTLDENANGNAGLKDQVMAFKWIQKNIENFGGDPNKVTIFGCSAGSVSVQLHMLSPKSRGLFHRAISQSGTPLNPWSFQRNPLEMTRRLASGFGINSTDNKVIVKELQKIPYDQLLKMIVNKNVMGPSLVYNAPPFSVSIESHSESAFLTSRAYKLLKKGKITSIPYIVGYNTEEGSFPYECAAHYAEVQYLLYPRHPHWNSTEEKTEDTLSRKRLIRLWVNFAYYGNPTPYKEDLLQNITWPTYCSKNTFLDIGKNLTLQHTYNDSNTVFWNELFNYCGFPPYYTY